MKLKEFKYDIFLFMLVVPFIIVDIVYILENFDLLIFLGIIIIQGLLYFFIYLRLHKSKKNSFISRFSGIEFKIVSNLFYDYNFKQNRVIHRNNSNIIMIPKLFKNIVNDLNNFIIERRTMKSFIFLTTINLEDSILRSWIIPHFKFIRYKIEIYNFRLEKDIDLLFTVLIFKSKKNALIILLNTSKGKFNEIENYIRKTYLYSSRLPMRNTTLSQFLNYSDTLMQFKIPEKLMFSLPAYYEYSRFLTLKQFDENKLQKFQDIIKADYIYDFLKTNDEIDKYKVLFENPIMNEITTIITKPMIIDVKSGEQIITDWSKFYFNSKLDEIKFIFQVVKGYDLLFIHYNQNLIISLKNFLGFLFWIDEIEDDIPSDKLDILRNTLLDIKAIFKNMHEANLAYYNIIHNFKTSNGEDEFTNNPFENYITLLNISISIIDNIVFNKQREYLKAKRFVSFIEDDYEKLLRDSQLWINFMMKAIKDIENKLWDFKTTLGFFHETNRNQKKKLKIEFCSKVSSFSNSRGGVIFIGITDSLPRKIQGVEDIENRITDLYRTIRKYTNIPRLLLEVDSVRVPDSSGKMVHCIRIIIPQTSNSIYVKDFNKKRQFYFREGPSTELITAEKINIFKESITKDNLDFLKDIFIYTC